MPTSPPSDRARRIARLTAKFEEVERRSPTARVLFEEWIDRLLAGEPLEHIDLEMQQLRDMLQRMRDDR